MVNDANVKNISSTTFDMICYLNALSQINEIVSKNPENTSLNEVINQVKQNKEKAIAFDLLKSTGNCGESNV